MLKENYEEVKVWKTMKNKKHKKPQYSLKNIGTYILTLCPVYFDLGVSDIGAAEKGLSLLTDRLMHCFIYIR